MCICDIIVRCISTADQRFTQILRWQLWILVGTSFSEFHLLACIFYFTTNSSTWYRLKTNTKTTKRPTERTFSNFKHYMLRDRIRSTLIREPRFVETHLYFEISNILPPFAFQALKEIWNLTDKDKYLVTSELINVWTMLEMKRNKITPLNCK